MPWPLVIILIVFALVAIKFVHSEWKKKQSKTLFEAPEIRTALFYRYTIDKIKLKYGLPEPKNTSKLVLEEEVIMVSSFILNEIIRRSDKTSQSLCDREKLILSIIGFVITNYISRLADVSFEMTSIATCSGVLIDKNDDGNEMGEMMSQTINAYNQLTTEQEGKDILELFGRTIERFAKSCGEEIYLDKLSKAFILLTKSSVLAEK